MKYSLLLLITVYQKFISGLLKNIFGVNSSCRFFPTCSEYAKLSIEKYGILKGGLMTVSRISKCQPFYKAGNGQSKTYG